MPSLTAFAPLIANSQERNIRVAVITLQRYGFAMSHAIAALVLALVPENGSQQMGTATLVPHNHATQIRVVLRGEPVGAVEPANVHAGTCDAVAQIRYPLHDVRNGHSTSTVSAPLTALRHAGYVIAVQASPASLRAAKEYHYVSCATL